MVHRREVGPHRQAPAREMGVPTSPPRPSEAKWIRHPKPGGQQTEQLSLKGEFAEGASACASPPIAEVQCWLREGRPWFDLDQAERRVVHRNKKARQKSATSPK